MENDIKREYLNSLDLNAKYTYSLSYIGHEYCEYLTIEQI